MADGADEIRITLRMPARVRDQIARDAASSGRSLNAEIVARLESRDEQAERLKSELNEERIASKRATDLVGQQMDLIYSYRDIVRRASAEVVQHTAAILSLCDFIEGLEERPTKEMLDSVARIRAGAELAKAHHEAADKPDAKAELRKLDAAIAKADKLLEDDEY